MECKEVGCEVVDWIHLTQNQDQWQALLNKAMSLQFP
jgi:hypothetical protein